MQIGLVPRPRPNDDKLRKLNSVASSRSGLTEQDLAQHNKFWTVGDVEDDNDSNTSYDEYGFLVEALAAPKDSDAKDEEEESKPEGVSYPDVDVDEVVKMLDVACQAKMPLDSRLLLLAVQRDWVHGTFLVGVCITLSLCSSENVI